LSIAVSTQAKSVAMIALDCDLMNFDHVGQVRSRVDTGCAQDLPDGGRGEAVAEPY
jgi:hypothetical protein